VRLRWIGGSPCAGKSTVAPLVAAAVYCCDDAFYRHALTIGPAAGPTLTRVVAMPLADRLGQPMDVQVDDLLRMYREEFPLILADLTGAPGDVVAEGVALLPELLAARRVPPDEAVWMVPTEEFQRHHYGRRAWARAVLAGRPDADALFDRWMTRDTRFAAVVTEQARDLGHRVLVIDGSSGIAELAARLRAIGGVSNDIRRYGS
jgi:hypothetical protein